MTHPDKKPEAKENSTNKNPRTSRADSPKTKTEKAQELTEDPPTFEESWEKQEKFRAD